MMVLFIEAKDMAQPKGKANTAYKHGCAPRGKRPSIYWRWRRMIARCHQPKAKDYANYGARGIEVCIRWRTGEDGLGGFECWALDMGPVPFPDASIDRIDGTRGYEPGNCRWATIHEQANNRRTNVLITARGQTMTVAQWARTLGIGSKTIGYRLRQGLDPEVALFTKPDHGNKLIGQMSKIQGNKS